MFQLPHHNSFYKPQKDGALGVKLFIVQMRSLLYLTQAILLPLQLPQTHWNAVQTKGMFRPQFHPFLFKELLRRGGVPSGSPCLKVILRESLPLQTSPHAPLTESGLSSVPANFRMWVHR